MTKQNNKIKFHLLKIDNNGLVFKILEQDSRFWRKQSKHEKKFVHTFSYDPTILCFESSNGWKVISFAHQGIYPSQRFVCLMGSKDYGYRSKCKQKSEGSVLFFNSEKGRDNVYDAVLFAIEDWSKNAKGFQTETLFCF